MLTAARIEDFSRRVEEWFGLEFPRRKWPLLQDVLEEMAAAENRASVDDFLSELLAGGLNRVRSEYLISRLTVGETYFFRDKEIFQWLRRDALPELIGAAGDRRRLEIFCLASSSGEEPYSLAILFDQLRFKLAGWQLNLFAGDLNLEVLNRARQAAYSQWSMRDLPDEMIDAYFLRLPKNRFQLLPRIRNMVTFHQVNLAQPDFILPGYSGQPADLIMCRNVMIYFPEDLRRRLVNRLVTFLRPGGYLLVAPSELGVVAHPELETITRPGVICHRRRQAGASFSGAAIRRNISRFRSEVRPRRKRDAPAAVPAGRQGEQRPERRKDAVETKTLMPSLSHPKTEDARPARVTIDNQLEEVHRLADQGQLAEAAELLSRLLTGQELNPDYWYLAALIARGRGDFGAALENYRRAIFLEPDFIMAHFSLATLLCQLDKISGAERHFRTCRQLLSDHPADWIPPWGEGLVTGRLLAIISDFEERRHASA